jgi:hypothetical protein
VDALGCNVQRHLSSVEDHAVGKRVRNHDKSQCLHLTWRFDIIASFT